MKNLLIALLAFTLLISFSSCKETLMGPDELNDPENNFELLWNDLNNHYGLFQARGWDWDAVYDEFRPQVSANTTNEELWTIMTNMLETLDDSHTYIQDRRNGEANKRVFISGYELNYAAKALFDRPMIAETYLEDFEIHDENEFFATGKVQDKNIGYIHLKGFGDYPIDLIDEVMVDMQNHDAIIIDIRNNHGGSPAYAQRISGKFIDKTFTYATMKDKNGPGPNDFSAPQNLVSIPGENPFLKPVIVLTNRSTISAAEDFLLMMKPFDHVTQIGDTTAGDFSDTSMIRFLPNGWEFGYSTREYRTPAGDIIDGIGHIPDVLVMGSEGHLQNGIDLHMQTTIQYLKTRYGIE